MNCAPIPLNTLVHPETESFINSINFIKSILNNSIYLVDFINFVNLVNFVDFDNYLPLLENHSLAFKNAFQLVLFFQFFVRSFHFNQGLQILSPSNS